jgi:hypothetical protein
MTQPIIGFTLATDDPTGSERQQQQAVRGLIGTLAEHHGVELVERADFVVPFDTATGVVSGQEPPTGGMTGAPGTGGLREARGMSQAEMLRRFPVMRNRT